MEVEMADLRLEGRP